MKDAFGVEISKISKVPRRGWRDLGRVRTERGRLGGHEGKPPGRIVYSNHQGLDSASYKGPKGRLDGTTVYRGKAIIKDKDLPLAQEKMHWVSEKVPSYKSPRSYFSRTTSGAVHTKAKDLPLTPKDADDRGLNVLMVGQRKWRQVPAVQVGAGTVAVAGTGETLRRRKKK